MQHLPAEKYQFDEFELDVRKRRLRRDGTPVELKPKAFDLLRVLVENPGRLLSKEDLFRMVWENQLVEESNLTVNMSQIRKALGEKASRPRFIATVSGQGYRFIGEVRGPAGEPEEYVVESRSVARVTIEDFAGEHGKKVPARPARTGKPRAAALAAAAFALLALLAAGGYFWQTPRAEPARDFGAIAMKRLTNLGNVINGALSPDGNFYAYVVTEKDGRQSLWLGHINGGGENVQLRPAAEIVYFAIAFSPDGGSLFYNVSGKGLEDNTLFRIGVFGGLPEKIRERVNSYIAFSPDGRQFAFLREDRAARKSALFISETSAAGEREIASRPANQAFLPTTIAWSPDGKNIALAAVGNEVENTREIFVVEVENGAVKPFTSLGWNGFRALIWAADGKGLYAVAGEKDGRWDSQIWHVSYPEGRPRRIVSDLNLYGAAIGLSADGAKLLVFQTQHFSNIWVAPADDPAAAKQVTFELLGKRSGWDALEWTAAGKIVFTGFTDNSETLWTIDADGKNQRQIIPESRTSTYPGFSDDGQKMVFNSNRGGSWEIWIAGGDGSNMRPLTSGGNNVQPAISPDGSWIVYRSARDEGGFLWRIPGGGGEPVRFTEKPGSWPRYSPDGKQIACGYQVDGTLRLAILSAADGRVEKHFELPATANLNNGLRWTPDGRAVTYRDWSNGIWRQDLAGGAPRRLGGLPEEKLYAYGWSRDGRLFAFTRGAEIRDLVLIQNAN